MCRDGPFEEKLLTFSLGSSRDHNNGTDSRSKHSTEEEIEAQATGIKAVGAKTIGIRRADTGVEEGEEEDTV
jgi:hypothetical protein